MGGGGTSRFKVGDNPIYMTSTSLGILMNIHNLQQFKKFVHDCVDPYLKDVLYSMFGPDLRGLTVAV